MASYGRIPGALPRSVARTSLNVGLALLFCGQKSSHSKVWVLLHSSAAIPPYVALQEKVTHDQDKVISMCSGILTPTVDPVVGSLRNKDSKGVFRRLSGKKTDF